MAPNKKRKQQKLKQRRSAATHRMKDLRLPGNIRLVHSPAGHAKMSDVLMEFIEPFANWETKEELEKFVSLGIAAWNCALKSGRDRAAAIEQLAQAIPPEARHDFREVLEVLIQRKEELFAGNRRVIISYILTMKSTGPYLQVISTLEPARLPSFGGSP